MTLFIGPRFRIYIDSIHTYVFDKNVVNNSNEKKKASLSLFYLLYEFPELFFFTFLVQKVQSFIDIY